MVDYLDTLCKFPQALPDVQVVPNVDQQQDRRHVIVRGMQARDRYIQRVFANNLLA